MAVANVRRWGMGSPEPTLDDVGTIARSERPAMGHGQPRAARKAAFPAENGPIPGLATAEFTGL